MVIRLTICSLKESLCHWGVKEMVSTKEHTILHGNFISTNILAFILIRFWKWIRDINILSRTFLIGYGTPPEEQFSYLVIMIISIGLGLPLIILLAIGLYFCIYKLPKRSGQAYLNQWKCVCELYKIFNRVIFDRNPCTFSCIMDKPPLNITKRIFLYLYIAHIFFTHIFKLI